MIKRYIVNLGLAIFSVILALAVLEGALRITDYKKSVGNRQLRYYFQADATAGFDISENCQPRKILHEGNYYYYIWSNDIGCFDKPYTGEKNYTLLVGDSFTHHFSAFENKWGTLVEGFVGSRVLKCGVAGYGTRQELIKAEKIISKVKYPPKLIILGYFLNDLDDDYRFPAFTVLEGFLAEKRKIADYSNGKIEEKDDAYLQKRAQQYVRKAVCSRYDECSGCGSLFQKTKCFLLDGLLISNKIEFAASQMKSFIRGLKKERRSGAGEEEPSFKIDMLAFYPMEKFPWLRKAWDSHLDNLRSFKILAEKNSAKLLVVIIPAKEQVYPFTAEKGNSIDFEQPNRILKEFFQRENIEYFDLLGPFRRYSKQQPKKWLDPEKRYFYMRLDKHWSKKGEYLAGLLVSKFILENDLVDVGTKKEKLRLVSEKLKALE